jgi:cytochrome c2
VNNTDYFLLDYYNEVQQNKRTILPKKKEKDLENLIVYLKKRNRIRKEKG